MNLTHKGVIRGKGYILAENPFAVVIGGANMDILGRPASKLRVGDSNPGSVSCSPGGVGRNIAENLARLGSDTRLVTAVGKDAYGEMITAQCRQAGVDMGNSLQFEDAVTSTYLSVLDGDADMHVAINDMAILERLGPEVLKGLEDMLRRAELLVLDTNLSEAALSYLLSNFPQVPVFIDTVSCVKAMKIKPYLNAIHTLKPNLKEAEHLSGIEMRSKEDLSTIANWFHDQGVKRIFLSMGSEGVFVSDGGESQMVERQAGGNGQRQWRRRCLPGRIGSRLAQAVAIAGNHRICDGRGPVWRCLISQTINPNMSEISVNRIIKESLC